MTIPSTVLLGLLLLAPPGEEARPRYVITDLGSAADLGPAAIPSKESRKLVAARSINEKGQVVGWFKEGDRSRAFLWEDGRRTFLTAPDARGAAIRINDRGQILLYHLGPRSPDGSVSKQHVFLWEGGKETDLKLKNPHDLNNRGQVLGMTEIDGENHLVLWEAGQVTDLSRHGVTGSVLRFGYSLNDLGQVIGTCDNKSVENRLVNWTGFLWENGRMTDLGGRVTPEAINNRGLIAGFRKTDPPGYCFLLEGGTMRKLDLLPGISGADLTAINDRGQMVGDVRDAGGKTGRAVLWENGIPQDLNEQIAAVSGWVLKIALDINDRGQIVGAGQHDGEDHAFLLTPR
jgi:probable HAF family extracellular repeat protein